jgi:PAS domain S-box-containing protein
MTDIIQRSARSPGGLDHELLDQIQAAVVVNDLQGTVLEWNAHAELVFGWTRDEAVGRNIVDLVVGPVSAPLALELLDRLARGERWEGELPARRKDGTAVPVLVTLSPLFDEAGAPIGAVGVSVDISERKRAELRLAAQYAVTRALSESDSLEEAGPPVLDALRETFDWESGGLWAIDPFEDRLRLVAMRHVVDAPMEEFLQVSGRLRFGRGEGLPGRVWESGSPLWIDDVTNDGNFPRAAVAAHAGLRSAFAFPLLVGESVVGVVELFRRDFRAPDEEMLEMISAIGSQLGQFVERKLAEEALRRTEARRSAILEVALDAVVVMDADGVITDFNPAAETMFGLARDEAVGRTVGETLVPPALRERHWEGLRRHLETGESRILGRRLELEAVRADGTEFPVELAVSRVDVDGPPAFTAYIRDLSGHRRAEEAGARLASIVESTDDAIIGKTLDGVIVSWNAGAERVYGYAPAEVIGRPVSMLVPPDERDDVPEILATVRDGRVERREVLRRRKDGEVIVVEITVSPIRNPVGDLIGASTIARDVTERKLAQERLRFLAEASRILAGSLAYEETLESIARLAAPGFSDWCIVYALQPDGSIRRLAMAASHEAMVDAADRIHRFRMRPDAERGVPEVIRSGTSALVPEVTPELLSADVDDPPGLSELLRPLDLRSWMAVPLRARGRTLGAISFVSAGPRARRYDADDLALAEELARHAAIAVDNATLYEAEWAARELAEQAARETQLLYSVTGALSEALTREQAAEVVVDRGVQALGASAGLIALLDGAGSSLEIVRWVGYRPSTMQEWERFPLEGQFPLSEAVRTGEPVLLETVAERVRRYPALKTAPDTADHALACIPLLLDGRALGGMVLTFDAPRRFSEANRAFLLALGRQCAQALERARLFDAERTARREAEVAQERLTFLAAASQALSGSLDSEEILSDLARLAIPRLADWTIVDVMAEDGSVRMLAAHHASPELAETIRELRRRFPPDWKGDHVIPRVIRTGRAEIAPSVGPEEIHGLRGGAGAPAMLAQLGLSSHLVVPLVARGRTLGAISFVFGHSGRHYSDEDLRLADDLARRAGLAMENARLFEAEQRERHAAEAAVRAEREARNEAEGARERLTFLAEASAALSSSLDHARTLAKVARLAVPRLADWCSVDVLEEDGTIHQLAVAHVDPKKVRLARQLRRRFPPDPDARTGVPGVIRSGRSELMAEISPQMIEDSVADPRIKKVVRDLALHSVMIVPLAARGRTFGAMSFVWAESGRTYGPDDLALAEDLARRAGQAVDNARLYAERDHIAHTLQQSLLPPELPAVPGLELAARYLPAGEGNEVGGDFYDLFDTGDGAWGIAVGDVCGKGAVAAAVMGLARYSLRATAMQERKPSRILFALNEAVRRQTTDGRFLTVCYVRVRAKGGTARLTVSCGGHPLPVLVPAEGPIAYVGQPGTLLGLFPDPTLHDKALELGPGDCLVLYTDGVTDLPGGDSEEGERRFLEVLASCRGLDAEAIAERVERDVLRRAGSGSRDDMALLVMRVSSPGAGGGAA